MRTVKTFLSKYSEVSKIDSEISTFLNDDSTGEIFEVITNVRNPNSYDLYYTFFYEYRTIDLNHIPKNTKSVNIKQSKSKPKLL